MNGAPVLAAGWSTAFPLVWTPPTTSMRAAVMLAVPLAVIAAVELESTSMFPGKLREPSPETVSAPAALG